MLVKKEPEKRDNMEIKEKFLHKYPSKRLFRHTGWPKK